MNINSKTVIALKEGIVYNYRTMLNLKFYPRILIWYFDILLLIFILIIPPISIVQSKDKDKSNIPSDQNIKNGIFAWLKTHSDPKPIKCDWKVKNQYNNTYLNGLVAPQVKIFHCKDRSKTPRFYFKGGKLKDGNLEGKGRLSYISPEMWSNLLPHNRSQIIEQNICLKAENLLEKNVKEIIGTFKKGLLHGNAKVMYDGNSFSIATYKSGKLQGYQRIFSPNGTLMEAGVYNGGWPTGNHWKIESSHLVFNDKSLILDDIRYSLVFPLSDDGMLKDVMAGWYNPYSGSLENIRRVKLTRKVSNTSDCVFIVKYKLLDKASYSYSTFSKTRFSLSFNDDDSLCKIAKKDNSSKPSIEIRDWFNMIEGMFNPSEDGFDASNIQSHKWPHELLWKLKPVMEEPDVDNSRKIISDVHLDKDRASITARILGSPQLQIKIIGGEVRFDKKGRPHGFNDFQVIDSHKHLVPKANTMGWVPHRIIGFYNHGKLNGIISIATDRSNIIWATVRNGILHGPTITIGINFIMEEVSKIECNL